MLTERSALPVKSVRAGRELPPATAHVAPAGRHFLVGHGPRLLLWDSPAVQGLRPAVDPLFHSAARVFGKRLLAVTLGTLGGDGSTGARAVRDAGGTVLAQEGNASGALCVSESAVATLGVGHVLPVRRIAPALHSLVSSGAFEAW